jgi:tetratricopeptide (TPR) repeat protein
MNLRLTAVCLTLFACSLSAFGDDDHHHMGRNDKMGNVSFPISCAPESQKPFELSVAMLHSFEYEQAESGFKQVAAKDPQCAMAYWGQSLTLFHLLWARPSKADLQRGNELAQKAQQLKPGTKTKREQEYIDAVSALYQTGEIEHKKRLANYANAMEKVASDNPKDTEAQAFYAVALLGAAPEDDPTHAQDRKAVAILTKIFEVQPDHPGIAHYIIHSCDNPQMAPLGLAAAREYAKIAPASPHAVHMPSHIFSRLGLWQDSIASNAAALKAADKMAEMNFHMAHHRMHAMDYQHYAYLQIGDDQSAKAVAETLAKWNRAEIESDYQDYYDDMVSSMAARFAIERRQWQEALALQPTKNAAPSQQVVTYWARAIAAGHLHDSESAHDALKHYDELLGAIRKKYKEGHLGIVNNEHNEVRAWAAYADGKSEDALRILREVADNEDRVGKGETESPAREMLADILLESNRPKEALAEYEVALKTDPNRFNELNGAAQAAEKLDQKEKAAQYYAQLLKNCQGIDSDRPELAKAKTLVAAK